MTSLGLAIDFGTSNTAAVLRRSDGRVEPLLFDGSPLLPSAVCAQTDGTLLTGRAAMHSARFAPERFEPNPKLRVDDATLLLGHTEVAVAEVFAAVIGRVVVEARRVANAPILQVALTHPASWGPHRRGVLGEAAHRAGLGDVQFVAEPVAAASYLRGSTPADTAAPIVIYDLGGGTFDVTIVAGDQVLAAEGLSDTGGLDVDAAIVAYLDAVYRPQNPTAWARLREPSTPADRRAWRQFTDDVRTAKEVLSSSAQAYLHIPLADIDAPLGREQLDSIAQPLVARTLSATKAAINSAGLTLPPAGPVFLAGGASRMPLVTTMLHRHLKTAPTICEQPELAVAHGALNKLRWLSQTSATSVSVLSRDERAERPAGEEDHARNGQRRPIGAPQQATTSDPSPDSAAVRGAPRPRRHLRRRVVLLGGLAALGAAAVPFAVHFWPSNRLTGDDVHAVAFSPDGKNIAGGNLYGGGWLWDAATGKRIATFSSDDDSNQAVAFSPDGKTLATAGLGDKLVLRDAATGAVTRRLNAPVDAIRSLAFSPDGTHLVAGGNVTPAGAGHEICTVWRLPDGERVRSLPVPNPDNSEIRSVAFHKDGGHIVIGGENVDGSEGTGNYSSGCRIWDLSTGGLATIYSAETTNAVAASPDGTLFALATEHGCVLLRHGNIDQPTTLTMDKTDSLAFSPDGRTLASGGTGGVRLWNIDAGRHIATVSDQRPSTMAFSPDGKTLVSGGWYVDNEGCWLWPVKQA